MSFIDDLSGKLNELSGKLKDADLSELGGKLNEVGNNMADAISVGARTAYGRAKNAAEIGGMKLKLADAEKTAATAYEAFGRKYMELHKDDADPALLEEHEAIKEAEKKVLELKKQIEDSKAATAAAEAAMKEKLQSDQAARKEAKQDEDSGDEFCEEGSDFTEVSPEESPAEAGEEPKADEAGEETSAEADKEPKAEEAPEAAEEQAADEAANSAQECAEEAGSAEEAPEAETSEVTEEEKPEE